MPTTAIVDASVALKWQFQDEPDTEPALALLLDYRAGGLQLAAPSLFAYEIANAVAVAVRRGRLPEEEAEDTVADLLSLGLELVEFVDLALPAYRLAQKYQRSVYDGAYLTLAEKRNCPLHTGDRRLFNAVKAHLPFVHWIGDYQSPMETAANSSPLTQE